MLLPHQKVSDVIWFHLVNSFRSILDSNQTLYSLIELNRFCYVFSISYRTFVHNTLFYRDMNFDDSTQTTKRMMLSCLTLWMSLKTF